MDYEMEMGGEDGGAEAALFDVACAGLVVEIVF